MTRWLGLALVPCRAHIDAAVALQQRVGAGTTLEPVLGRDGNLPHVTLYQGPILDPIDPQKTLDSFKAAAGLEQSISAPATKIYYQPAGWIFLGLEKTPQLERLHVEAVRAVDAWIDRRTIDPGLDVSQYTEVERQSYYQYGYRYTGDAFMPHITLGHTDDASVKLLVQRPVGRRFDTDRWIFDRVTFYEMGEHGAHSRVLAEAPLRHA